MSYEPTSKQTAAFAFQAAVSFAVASGSVLAGILYLPVNAWMRAFLGLGVLYVITSTFTLAKVVRDAAESTRVVSRIDEARLERYIAEHDPFVSPLDNRPQPPTPPVPSGPAPAAPR